MTYTAKALVKTKSGKLKIENNTLLCCCPDCNAPMTVRVWLRLANCWRCGTSIQLTFDQIRQFENRASKTQQPSNSKEPEREQPVPASPNLTNPFKVPWPFIISFLLNALIILILALLFFTQTNPRKVIDLELSMTRPGTQKKSILDLIPLAVTKPEVAKVTKAPKPISHQNEQDTTSQGDQVTFFNTKAKGNRFVYIIDRSGSMNTVGTSLRGICKEYQRLYANKIWSRFDSARREIIRSVASLNSNQEFYVFLFSDNATFMFDHTETFIPDLVPATSTNKINLSDWLGECVVNGSTNPTLAVQLALNMEPDAIFLLSDGAFMIPNGQPTPISIILRNSKIPIHTIAYEDEFAQTNLKRISQRTGGEFRFVPMISRTKQILDSNDPRDTKSLLQSFSDLPMQSWPWKKRLEMAKAILDSAHETTLDKNLFFGAVQNLAFGLQPESNQQDTLGDWELRTRKIKDWDKFWIETDSLYQKLKNQRVANLPSFDSKVKLAGMQLLCDYVVGNRNSIVYENYQNVWHSYLTSMPRDKLTQAKEKNAGISDANTPIAFASLSTLGLLISNFDDAYCKALFKEHVQPIDRITIAKTIVEFQDQIGVTEESHFLLKQIFKSRSPDRDEPNLNQKWKSIFNKVVDQRRSKARSLYRKYQRSSSEKKTGLAKQLIDEYPETSFARIIHRRLKQEF